jgi:hypothetical protein
MPKTRFSIILLSGNMAKDVPGGTCSTLLIYMTKFHYICLYNIMQDNAPQTPK